MTSSKSSRMSKSQSAPMSAVAKLDVNWRCIVDVSPQEHKALETGWDARHGLHFSRNNKLWNPGLRDYFDRQRDDQEHPGVKPQVRWRPTWLLTVGYQNKDIDPSKAVTNNIPRGAPIPGKKKQWDDRHWKTHSEANGHYHDGNREYFSRHVNARSVRLLPLQPKGIQRSLFPHCIPGNPEGCDDEPSTAELMVKDDHRLPPLPGPTSRVAVGARELVERVPGRPDASFDCYGD